MNALAKVAASRGYWVALVVLGASLEAMALFFQHVLGYGPCVLCIHVRILMLCLILVAVLALVVRGSRAGRVGAHLLTTVVLAALVYRAWMLLGVERGFVAGECSFDLGLPAWLALDRWFPAMFQVYEACGYTPSLPFGFTMAEVLLPLAVILFALSAALLFATLGARRAGS